MRILVIGANGKIGRLVCKQGADLGMEMLGFNADVLCPFKNRGFGGEVGLRL